MPYSEDLADRVRARMAHLDLFTERAVMSGLGFFINDRMAVAVLDEGLCLRVDEVPAGRVPDGIVLHPLEFAGRAIQGWVCMSEEDLDDASLSLWVSLGIAGVDLSM
jgi:hypothetical protein